MRQLPSESERLALLNEGRPGLLWKSCAEKRVCLPCERTFRGSATKVRTLPQGGMRLVCPGCGSAPGMWVRLGNPFTDEEVWRDWERAIAHSSADAGSEELLVTR